MTLRPASRCGTETWPDLRLKWPQVDGRLDHTRLHLTAACDFSRLQNLWTCDELAWWTHCIASCRGEAPRGPPNEVRHFNEIGVHAISYALHLQVFLTLINITILFYIFSSFYLSMWLNIQAGLTSTHFTACDDVTLTRLSIDINWFHPVFSMYTPSLPPILSVIGLPPAV